MPAKRSARKFIRPTASPAAGPMCRREQRVWRRPADFAAVLVVPRRVVVAQKLVGGAALAVLLRRAAVCYWWARVFSRSSKYFAPKPAEFLDWARATGLLRVTGAAYLFRHQRFRD